MEHRIRRVIAGRRRAMLAALAVLAVGCSSDGEGEAADAAPTTVAERTTTTEEVAALPSVEGVFVLSSGLTISLSTDLGDPDRTTEIARMSNLLPIPDLRRPHALAAPPLVVPGETDDQHLFVTEDPDDDDRLVVASYTDGADEPDELVRFDGPARVFHDPDEPGVVFATVSTGSGRLRGIDGGMRECIRIDAATGRTTTLVEGEGCRFDPSGRVLALTPSDDGRVIASVGTLDGDPIAIEVPIDPVHSSISDFGVDGSGDLFYVTGRLRPSGGGQETVATIVYDATTGEPLTATQPPFEAERVLATSSGSGLVLSVLDRSQRSGARMALVTGDGTVTAVPHPVGVNADFHHAWLADDGSEFLVLDVASQGPIDEVVRLRRFTADGTLAGTLYEATTSSPSGFRGDLWVTGDDPSVLLSVWQGGETTISRGPVAGPLSELELGGDIEHLVVDDESGDLAVLVEALSGDADDVLALLPGDGGDIVTTDVVSGQPFALVDFADGQILHVSADSDRARFSLLDADGSTILTEVGAALNRLPPSAVDPRGDLLIGGRDLTFRCPRDGCDPPEVVSDDRLEWSKPPERSARVLVHAGCPAGRAGLDC